MVSGYVSTIAIDGPAASGKSSAGRRLASDLEYLYLDTGAMYRAVTWLALQRDVAPADAERLGRLAASTRIDVLSANGVDDGRHYTVCIEGRDVTWALRTPAGDAAVSAVSAHRSVRAALTQQQRRIGRAGDVVRVGRDIGTVVMPEAGLKVYLDAPVEVRARRRYADSVAQGRDVSYEEILDAMRQRDAFDSTRAAAPLRPADDAICLNTADLTLEDVVQRLLNFARAVQVT